MADAWPPERRLRQAARIREWRPWEKSTGPRTDEGKAISAKNSFKHGNRSKEALEDLRWLRDYLDSCIEIVT